MTKIILRVVVTLGILAIIVSQVDLTETIETFKNTNPWWAIAAFLLVLADELAVGYLWRRMIVARGHDIPYFDTMRIVFASDFFGVMLPSSMGADAVKVVGLTKYLSETKEALTSLVMLRVVGYFLLFTIAAIVALLFSGMLPGDPVVQTARWVALGLFVAGILLIILFKPLMGFIKRTLFRFNKESIFDKLKGVYESLLFYATNKGVMIALFIGGLFLQLSKIFYMYLVALALGLDVSFTLFFIFVPLVTALALIPVALSGIGVREGGYTLLFSYAGLTNAEAISLALGGLAVMMCFNLFAGLFYSVFGFPNQR